VLVLIDGREIGASANRHAVGFGLVVALLAASGAQVARGALPVCDTNQIYPLTAPTWAYYAVAKHGLRAFARPGRQTRATFGRLNVNQFPTVFGVLGAHVSRDCRPVWFRVQLPMRPNGVTGFVRASSVRTGLIRVRVLVDLSDHRLTLYRTGSAVLRAPIAIGSPATPTPTGRFYVNQRLVPEDTSGPFGPGAIGISAFSDVLTGWAQGGPIAIHGTNQPSSIGRSISNGCIRVQNDVLNRLWRSVLPGTPVVIRR
jgi:lipoprotein-anchoring transpeptidase ErfK/SrfK